MHEKEINRLLEEAKSIKEVRLILNEYEGEYDNFLRGLSLSIRYKKPLQKLIRVYPQYMETCEYYLNKKFAKRCLEMACKYKRYDIVKLMLARGAIISNYILHKMANSNYIEVIDILIKNIDLPNKEYILRTACRNGCTDLVRFLLKYGIDKYGFDKDTDKCYPCINFTTAVDHKYIDIVCLFLEYGSVNIKSLNCGFTRAIIFHEDMKMAKLLLYHGADPSSALPLASCNNLIDIAKYLLKNGADVHYDNDESLTNACFKGYFEIVKLLIEHGADIHIHNNRSLQWASMNGHLEVVKLLIENGADIHAKNNNALYYAYLYGHEEVAKLLIEYGANMCIFLPFANEKLTEQKTDL